MVSAQTGERGADFVKIVLSIILVLGCITPVIAAPSESAKPSALDAARLLVSDGLPQTNVVIKTAPPSAKLKLALPVTQTRAATTLRKRKADLLTTKRSLGTKTRP